MKSTVLLAARGKTFPLADPGEPELFREQFPFSQVPRIIFDGVDVPLSPPDEIWITDTTFRDGQQARPPYTPKQIARIYSLLHRLGGPRGIIRQCEFFLYSRRDREAVQECLSLGFGHPEITGWIRADARDLGIVKDLGLKETGILTSASDYHIFLKLKTSRRKAMEEYLCVVKEALSSGIRIRCHLEDVTRADIYGFCLPFAEELLRLNQESGIPVKVRLCDTMGYGVTYPGAVLPRSIPRLVHAFVRELGYPSELLEWHGHNDFHKVHVNAATAWLYGVSALNATVLGFGERTGNPPLEAAVMEYIALRGTEDGMDTRVISEIADYFRTEVKAPIPANYPFVGAEFNTTRAGIHADGLMKNQEIYNIFDTEKILGRPIRVMVTDKSGMAGIAQWLNENVPALTGISFAPLGKRHPGVRHISAWVAQEYEQGRTTSISTEELVAQARHYLPHLFVSDFERIKRAAMDKAHGLAEEISASPAVQALQGASMERFLRDVVKREASIQLIAITNTEGRRTSQVHTQRGEKSLFRNLLTKDFRKHEWFVTVLENCQPYYSDLFFSKYTGRLIMTAALPIVHEDKSLHAVIDIDFIFDELSKLVT
ncbi:MAG: histone-lysine N-methyltransferase [Spirochaetia bacterium]|jgi:isopropylmalate/homocitrate/citramalate synthase